MELNISPGEHLELDETLRRLEGDEEILRELFVVFTKDAPLKLERLRAAVVSADMPLVARDAHALKGAAAVVGADKCRGLAVALEQAAMSGDTQAVEALFEDVKDEMKIVLEIITKA